MINLKKNYYLRMKNQLSSFYGRSWSRKEVFGWVWYDEFCRLSWTCGVGKMGVWSATCHKLEELICVACQCAQRLFFFFFYIASVRQLLSIPLPHSSSLFFFSHLSLNTFHFSCIKRKKFMYTTHTPFSIFFYRNSRT